MTPTEALTLAEGFVHEPSDANVADAKQLIIELAALGWKIVPIDEVRPTEEWTRATAKGTTIDVDEWGNPLYVRNQAAEAAGSLPARRDDSPVSSAAADPCEEIHGNSWRHSHCTLPNRHKGLCSFDARLATGSDPWSSQKARREQADAAKEGSG